MTFSDGRQRSAGRRARTIQKNILKGLRQTVGAVKKLKNGIQVYRNDGTPLEVDPPEVVDAVEPLDLCERAKVAGHGIVLVSDLHEHIDGKAVWRELQKASAETRDFYHVLDLQELHGLIVNANGHTAVFESYLIERWKRTATHRNALLRLRFLVS